MLDEQHEGPRPILLAAGVREVERALGDAGLMERAGLAAAEVARAMGGSGGPVLVLAGPGNNGGDAFVVARWLRRWWHDVELVFTGDEARLSADAATALAAWRSAGGSVQRQPTSGRRYGLAIDGLFGIGLARDLAGPYPDLVRHLNALSCPVLALDVPSGLDSDSGRVMGCAVRAAATVTFIALKPGLLTLEGPDLCGHVHVADLGIDPLRLQAGAGHTIPGSVLRNVLPARARNSHKGSYGSVGILGGATGMTGAAIIAGRAALRTGAGRVYVGLASGGDNFLDPCQPELMVRPADAVAGLDHLTCLAVGPGLGQSPDAARLLRAALETSLPVVVDADALNLVGANPDLAERLVSRSAPAVLTPHPAEAARLARTTTSSIQADRVGAAVAIARRLRSHVVLKGAGTVCAAPDGAWWINTTGNPGLASAGMGDALTGFIAALIAQGADATNAMLAGVRLHGAAADDLVARGAGPAGLTASEVIDAARGLINRCNVGR